MLEDTIIKIHELRLAEGYHLFYKSHYTLNTLFDFSQSKDYQILYFDTDKNFTGTTYVINKNRSDFLVQTQAKWVLLIPINEAISNNKLNKISTLHIAYNQTESVKEAVVKQLKEAVPPARGTGVGMLATAIRRKNIEKDLNIPIPWRSGVAISVATGKAGNEMIEEEWNTFYSDLCENLKRDYPELYESMFPL
ncbi:hypothetical protein [Formosa haliotis]|uniref:hypothetical protein n=1 Tax=Formosa haliotis TaxID=1555194 RepID=UPI000826D664|nr:hypothetical protein [Formosa haliotis]